ncbi:MAG: YitT family protein [Clostridia bacterium]|nr:YitT family protein [Clostridia bacterium]
MKVKLFFRDCVFVVIGSAFIAVALNIFLVPYRLSSGGIGTLGVILLYLFKVPLSLTNLVLNVLLFGLGMKFLKKQAILKTILGILFLSFFLYITTFIPAYKEDIFLGMVIGGVLDGIGMGLVLRVDGSTGGIDFLALMVRKIIPHISVANFIFAINTLLFILSGIVFKNYAVVFYSIIAMFISSKVTDVVMSIGDQAKSIQIISEKYEEIEEIVLEQLQRGVTEIYSKGAYTKEEKKVLLCVVKPKEVPKIVRAVKTIDKNAFLIISNVHEVLGDGFKTFNI